MKLLFYIRFHTQYGQRLWVSGNSVELGENDPEKAIPLVFLNEEFWVGTVEIGKKCAPEKIRYRYALQNEEGTFEWEWGGERELEYPKKPFSEIHLMDTWKNRASIENVFYTDPFANVLFKQAYSKGKITSDKNCTHIFRVKAPLLKKNEIVCISGMGDRLNNWSASEPIFMGRRGAYWEAKLDLSGNNIPLEYKYGVYHLKEKSFVYESGNNRLVFGETEKKKLTIIEDGYAHLPNQTWKSAGIAIPVFSLRSRKGLGTGEFTDIKLLVDWAAKSGFHLVQLLPIHDTVSAFSWQDSYPYSAVSAFALHPIYVNLEKIGGKDFVTRHPTLGSIRKKCNELGYLDYEEVMNGKFSALKELYIQLSASCFASEEFKIFFKENNSWLESYSAFACLRDKNKTADFTKWKTSSVYDSDEIKRMCDKDSEEYPEIAFHYFIQFHLHRQLQDAVAYAHRKKIVLKGDIPIGISRNSCDAWVNPGLYNMEWQAGAPPDDFTSAGQNWGFPTYNWNRMKENGFSWWKQRFSQMSNYFDAFRIDHILGFFRIWSIPVGSVQGVMGRFIPCIPVQFFEFGEKGICFDQRRFCKPFITFEIINEIFNELSGQVINEFVCPNTSGGYDLLPEFETQRQVETHFLTKAPTGENEKLKLGLFDLISNVILFEENEIINGESVCVGYHFRFAMDKTSSFKHLSAYEQDQLRSLYIDYFYKRQDPSWFREAMQKLPGLKDATNMLVCGEDLGMVPHCVPDVMRALGILSLEIQRMPKNPGKEFFLPEEAPYLSVITPSTHDMSTVRGWWEENRQRTQFFYNAVLKQSGEAPLTCETWISRAIILQHVFSPAMWSLFQLQDILAIQDTLRRENTKEERINDPANPKHYWQYRMHITLEDLLKEKEFCEELKKYMVLGGRA